MPMPRLLQTVYVNAYPETRVSGMNVVYIIIIISKLMNYERGGIELFYKLSL